MTDEEYTRTLVSWQEMHRRCYNPRRAKYAAYGARGIQVDPRWSSLNNFIEDMGPRPNDYYTLGRLDNNGDYTKSNCRWETSLQQAANKGPYRNNTSGLKGVAWEKKGRTWLAYANRNWRRQVLYRGPSLFEACCQRKSWENAYDAA